MAIARQIWIITGGPERSASARGSVDRIAQSLSKAGHSIRQIRSDQLASIDAVATPPHAFLYFFPEALPDNIAQISREACRAARPLVPVQIGLVPADVPAGQLFGMDSLIRCPAHPSQIIRRLDFLFRLKALDQELSSREQTLAQSFNLNIQAKNESAPRNLRLLFIGKPHPAFLAVMNAVQEESAEVIAAFTSFSGFDFLHKDAFDAVILSAIEDSEPALTIAKTMRRNSALFNVPSVLLTQGSESEMSQRYADHGLSDVVNAQADAAEIAGRICELAGGHLMHDFLRERFRSLDVSDVIVKQTGLYNKSYFDAHLRRHRAIAESRGSALSVGVLSLRSQPGSAPSAVAFRAACLQVGTMLRSLMRLQDFPAQLSDSQYVVIFPETTPDEAQIVLARIANVVEQTGFDDFGQTFMLRAATEVVANNPRRDTAPATAPERVRA